MDPTARPYRLAQFIRCQVLTDLGGDPLAGRSQDKISRRRGERRDAIAFTFLRTAVESRPFFRSAGCDYKSHQSPIRIKCNSSVASVRPGGLPPPQKNVGTVPRPNNTTDRSVVIDYSMPTPNCLTVRAIPCCSGGGAAASIQVWWLIANPYVWLAGTA
jgi:hypothetical protein